MRVFLASFMLAAVLCGAVALDLPPTGCTPAQDAVFKQVEDTILNFLDKRATLEAIETAVAALVPGGTDVDRIIDEAIAFLHDTGALPADVWPSAQAMQLTISTKAHFVKGAAK